MQANTTGGSNVALGREALRSNTTGADNIGVGFNALYSNSTGANNIGIGSYALFSNSTANSNVAMGFNALAANTTGSANSGYGQSALGAHTTGSGNTAVGFSAANTLTTGGSNTIIGASTVVSAVTVSNEIVIGAGLTGKGTQTAFIGGTTGAYNAADNASWLTVSDERIKKNISDNTDGIDKINSVRVRNYEYRAPEEITDLPQSCAATSGPGMRIGVIAQELRAVLPECVTEAANGMLSVSTDPLVWYLINAVQTLSAEVAALKAERTAQ
jgi:hypothetical protein